MKALFFVLLLIGTAAATTPSNHNIMKNVRLVASI